MTMIGSTLHKTCPRPSERTVSRCQTESAAAYSKQKDEIIPGYSAPFGGY